MAIVTDLAVDRGETLTVYTVVDPSTVDVTAYAYACTIRISGGSPVTGVVTVVDAGQRLLKSFWNASQIQGLTAGGAYTWDTVITTPGAEAELAKGKLAVGKGATWD